MTGPDALRMPWWAWVFPVLSFAVLAAAFTAGLGAPLSALAAVVLIATVFAAVWHAELVAHRVGEPFGTLVLAIAVTVIEVALIVSVMLGGGADKAALARDTVFAAVMLVCNGVVGGCLVAGGMRHGRQGFQVQGASAALAVLAALTILTLVLPNYTVSTPGPVFTAAQLGFVAVVSLLLYGAFVFEQTVRSPADFLPDEDPAKAGDHGLPPSNRQTLVSAGLLVVALLAVVGLAKALSPAMEAGIAAAGAPKATIGVVIAALVLLPEAVTALRAARDNRLQTSLNLALGSALASIGLTIPAVAAVSILLHVPLTLGLDPKDTVLLALTLIAGVVTLGTGRTTTLQGVVHLVILAAYLFLSVVP